LMPNPLGYLLWRSLMMTKMTAVPRLAMVIRMKRLGSIQLNRRIHVFEIAHAGNGDLILKQSASV